MNIWERELAKPVVDITDDFFELGGNEARAETMIETVARETGVRVPLKSFRRSPTVLGLADALLEKHSDDEIAEIQRGNGAVPIFFFHGDILGGGLYTRPLAARLGKERPFYVVPPVDLEQQPVSSIEEVATQRVAQIRRHRPHGPYVLGGFCIGGLVAYETARQLAAEGEEVQSVILVDPELPDEMERWSLRAIDKLARRSRRAAQERIGWLALVNRKLTRLQDVVRSPWREQVQFVVSNTRKLFRRPPVEPESWQESGSAVIERNGWRIDAFQWLATAYDLKPFNGRVMVLLTREQEEARPRLVERWSAMVSELSFDRLPGRHMTAITKHRDILAEKIRAELQALQPACASLITALAFI